MNGWAIFVVFFCSTFAAGAVLVTNKRLQFRFRRLAHTIYFYTHVYSEYYCIFRNICRKCPNF